MRPLPLTPLVCLALVGLPGSARAQSGASLADAIEGEKDAKRRAALVEGLKLSAADAQAFVARARELRQKSKGGCWRNLAAALGRIGSGAAIAELAAALRVVDRADGKGPIRAVHDEIRDHVLPELPAGAVIRALVPGLATSERGARLLHEGLLIRAVAAVDDDGPLRTLISEASAFDREASALAAASVRAIAAQALEALGTDSLRGALGALRSAPADVCAGGIHGVARRLSGRAAAIEGAVLLVARDLRKKNPEDPNLADRDYLLAEARRRTPPLRDLERLLERERAVAEGALMGLAARGDVEVVLEVMRAATAFGDELTDGWAQILIANVEHEDLRVREAAFAALKRLGKVQAAPQSREDWTRWWQERRGR